MKKHWKWLAGLLGFELFVALNAPRTILSDHQWLNNLVWLLGQAAPVVHNFGRGSPISEVINLYLAVAILLMPAKVAFCYLWLNSNANFRGKLVVSPISKPVSITKFIATLEPVPFERCSPSNLVPKFSFGKFFISILAIAFTVGMVFVGATYGSELADGHKATLATVQVKYALIDGGGIGMWLVWTFTEGLISLLVASSICTLQDYFQYFLMMFGIGRAHS